MGNPHGTAPGWWVEHAGRVIIALPGPPRELRPMWQGPRPAPAAGARPRGRPCRRDTAADRHRRVDGRRCHRQGAARGREPAHRHLRAGRCGRCARQRRRHRVADQRRHWWRTPVASLSPRLDPYVFARGDEDWTAALARRIGGRRLATAEVGTGGYLGLLLGTAPFLLGPEQRNDRHVRCHLAGLGHPIAPRRRHRPGRGRPGDR